ncbi:hypothetical protein AB9K34_18200 [Sedimentitalea sp. XS_ASV28]|uniref:hypothetical protein n=1 Tax=Sedimentitalea sp. XS_ASV28 TaxID=3241296 RepID=UPI003516948F
MIRVFNKFRKDDDGAVTVDWVVLTAAVVALAAAAYSAIETGTDDLSTRIQTELDEITPDASGGN